MLFDRKFLSGRALTSLSNHFSHRWIAGCAANLIPSKIDAIGMHFP
jgi:hypothetical protein